MKFKFEIDLAGPEFEGDVFAMLQDVLMAKVHPWLGACEWKFDDLRVPSVRLPLPQDEQGRSSQPVLNSDGVEVGHVGFYIPEQPDKPSMIDGLRTQPPPFKAPAAKR